MDKKNIFLEKNMIAGLVAILFGTAMLYLSGMTQGVYPFLVFLCIILLGLVISISTVLMQAKNRVGKITIKEIFLIASLFITPVFSGVLGFYVSSFLAICVISILIAPKRDGKEIIMLLTYAILATVATYMIFTIGLNIRSPQGALLLF